ncbi:response regulator [Brevibacillus borstelensis]|uniref:response regulator n=1 Tax=Brevibacillus borstelensis TaxID=45462 RepID=UPI0020418489|nr:response regulator [Brevibacillus borstelensis]MCM3468822.1 response regulator [Brevibacillus borstelensis]
MRLNVMLVDDEIHILKNLNMVIPWEMLDMQVVSLAQNGAEAWAAFQEHRPDLILSDIRMPIMDGVSLVKEIRDAGEACEVIMLTGFTDFEYTRSAIRYGVKDYIVKPINYQELHEVIERVGGEIRQRKQARLLEEKVWREFTELAKQKYLFDALMGQAAGHSHYTITGKTQTWGEKYAVFVADLDDYPQLARHWSHEERNLWNFSVQNVLRDSFSSVVGKESALVLTMREGEWCLLALRESPLEEAEIRSWASRLQKAVSQHLAFSISVGYYTEIVAVPELSAVYQQVKKAIHFDLARHEKAIFAVEPETSQESATGYNWWSLLEELLSGLKRHDLASIKRTLSRMRDDLQPTSRYSLTRTEQILRYDLLHLVREMKDMQIITGQLEELVWMKLERAQGIRELLQVIHQVLEDSIRESVKKKTGDVLMIRAMEYIQKHLTRDLGVEEVAGHLGISSSYFSLLFKQHTRLTFVEYLTQQRMERARFLLSMSGKTIHEISREVGYPDRRYFSKVFQRNIGLTPSEYREQAAQKE